MYLGVLQVERPECITRTKSVHSIFTAVPVAVTISMPLLAPST